MTSDPHATVVYEVYDPATMRVFCNGTMPKQAFEVVKDLTTAEGHKLRFVGDVTQPKPFVTPGGDDE